MSDMKNRKVSASKRRARQRKQRNRRIAMTVALVLVVALASIGGTIAWLTATTATVTNTFTTAGIDIDLTETWNTDTNNDDELDSWSAQLIPGKQYTKDPVVTVKSTTDVDVYLFVKVEDRASDYLTYTSTLNGNGWTQGTGTVGDGIPTDVWYRVVLAADTPQSWHLIQDDTVTVKENLVKKGTVVTGTDNVVMPGDSVTLTYTAYAIQKEGFANAAAAWAKIGN